MADFWNGCQLVLRMTSPIAQCPSLECWFPKGAATVIVLLFTFIPGTRFFFWCSVGQLCLKRVLQIEKLLRVPKKGATNYTFRVHWMQGCCKKNVNFHPSCKSQIVVQILQKWSTVCKLGLIATISTYLLDQWRKLYYEGRNFIHKLDTILKIFMNEGSHAKSWFKSGSTELRIWLFATNMKVHSCCSVPNERSRDQTV
jgi:hypothetical protein